LIFFLDKFIYDISKNHLLRTYATIPMEISPTTHSNRLIELTSQTFQSIVFDKTKVQANLKNKTNTCVIFSMYSLFIILNGADFVSQYGRFCIKRKHFWKTFKI